MLMLSREDSVRDLSEMTFLSNYYRYPFNTSVINLTQRRRGLAKRPSDVGQSGLVAVAEVRCRCRSASPQSRSGQLFAASPTLRSRWAQPQPPPRPRHIHSPDRHYVNFGLLCEPSAPLRED